MPLLSHEMMIKAYRNIIGVQYGDTAAFWELIGGKDYWGYSATVQAWHSTAVRRVELLAGPHHATIKKMIELQKEAPVKPEAPSLLLQGQLDPH